MTSDVERYLEARVESVRQLQGDDKATDTRFKRLALATGALEGLRIAGQVTDEEVGHWLEVSVHRRGV